MCATGNGLGTTKTSLFNWIKHYLLDCRARQLADGTMEFYTKKLQQFVRYCEERDVINVSDIDTNLLRSYLVWMAERGHNEGGISGSYRTIKTFLNWYENEAEPANWKNPIRRIKTPRPSGELLEPVSIEQVKTILKTFDGSTGGLRDTAMILTLFDTGLRANEMLNITMDDYDEISGSMNVMGKGRKPRTVFLGQKCRRAVRAYLRMRGDEPGYLFRDRGGGRLCYQGLRSVIRRACKKAGIDCPAVHSFRRGFALNMLRNGADIYTLQTLMGHADLQVLRRYLRQTTEDLELVHRRASPVDHNL